MNKIFYVAKKDMMAELVKYKETGIITEELGEMFLKIARRFTSKPGFSGYTYREDMISDAVARMVSQICKFDLNHPSANPFAYFTQIAYHQVISRIAKENKQTSIREKFRDKIWEDLSREELMDEDDNGELDLYDINEQFDNYVNAKVED